MKFLIILFIFLGARHSLQAQSRFNFTLNDLTHLYPLPERQNVRFMLQPQSAGTKGELLSYDIFQRLPNIVPSFEPDKMYQQSWKVVAVRIDPCNAEISTPNACQAQVRLVWQPLVIREAQVTTLDASIHTFYVLNRNEFQQMMLSYQNFQSRYAIRDAAALQVSPKIKSLGYASSYWQDYTKWILSFIGKQNLSRVTFMIVNPLGNFWVFAGYEYSQGQMQILDIPGIGKKSQLITATQLGSAETFFKVNPMPANNNLYFQFLVNSEKAKKTFTQEQILNVARTSFVIENPLRHHSGTIDCASCHLSRSVTSLMKTSFPQWSWPELLKGSAYFGNAVSNVVMQRPLSSEVLRMLGYFNKTPIISDRVLHETEESLKNLNRR